VPPAATEAGAPGGDDCAARIPAGVSDVIAGRCLVAGCIGDHGRWAFTGRP